MTKRSRAAVILFSTVSLAAIGFAVYLSLDPRQYFFYGSEDRAQWAYDVVPVVLICAVMALEAGVVGVALFSQKPRILWIRCGVALAILLPWTSLSTMFFVHAPGYVLFRHLWAWVLVLLLVAVGFSSAIRQFSSRSRREQHAV
jgi:hypothetical protein